MADSKNMNDSSTDDFADDLEAMLNEVESSSDEELELIDDEDAIDRLLMDDVFETGEENEPDQIENEPEMKAESDNTEELIEDEFSEDDVSEILSEEIADEFADDKDEFASEPEPEEPQLKTEETPVEPISESLEEVDEFSAEDMAEEDEFLLADFDISTDDDLGEESGDAESLTDEIVEDAMSELNDPVELPEETESAPQTEEVIQQSNDNNAVSLEDFEQLTAQINQLWSDNEVLKKQLSGLAIADDMNDSFAEEIEQLQKDNNKLKKSLKESVGKVPVLTYVALAVAIIALLVGGGLGFVGFGAESSVSELEELVVTLEEEIEVLIANDSSADIKKLNEKVVLLNAENRKISDQYLALNTSIKSNPLKPVVDDLVVQNDHAQVAIEQLLAKVDALESRKLTSNIPRKAKKVVPKPDWVVNLVSFKQDWYARRKAIEFEKKGVPAEVVKANVNGAKWFRLRVKGFKSKYAAAAYAVKVKKTLNLSSVWVTKK